MDLQFRYNPQTLKIESNDPEIFLEHRGITTPYFSSNYIGGKE